MDLPPVFERAAHLRQDLDYLEARLQAEDTWILPIHGDRSLLIPRGQAVEAFLPTLAEARSLLELEGELVWLGQLDGRACFALDIGALPEPSAHPAIPREVECGDLRYVLSRMASWQAGLASYGAGMLAWHRRQRYCGACGGSMKARRGGHLRVCELCQSEVFPRLDPAVLVLVRYEDRVLLGRPASWPKGMYSALAGFVEPGETLEEAVVREVTEEVGITVRDVSYQASQPWPFPASLMVGFTARAESDQIRLGDDELEEAAWFTAQELREPTRPGFFTPPPEALAGQLLARFALQE